MKIFLNIVGYTLLVMGTIWILQGVNILPGSFMTGQMQWAYRGAVAAVVGLAALMFANRRSK